MNVMPVIKRFREFLKTERGKRLSIRVAQAIAVFLVIGMIAPYFFSQDTLKQTLKQKVHASTGRTLSLDGSARIRIFPKPGLDVTNVTLSNPLIYDSAPPLLTVKELNMDFSLWELLKGNAEPSRVILRSPSINFYVDSEQIPNWEFNTLYNEMPPGQEEKKNKRKKTEAEPSEFIFPALSADVIISNGTISYTNALRDEHFLLENVSNSLSMNRSSNTLKAKGSGTWENEGADWMLDISNMKAFFTKERTRVNAHLTNKLFAINTIGFLERGGYSGNMNLAVSSLKETVQWLTGSSALSDIPSNLELNMSSNNVECVMYNYNCNINNANFKLDKLRGRTWIKFSTVNEIPTLNLKFTFSKANLSPLVPGQAKDKAAGESGKEPANHPLPKDIVWPNTITEKWSHKPIDLSFLKKANVTVKIIADELTIHKLQLTNAQIDGVANKGLLSIDIANTEMYSGKANINLSVDTKVSPFAWRSIVNMTAVDTRALLHQLLNLNTLGGVGTVQFNASSNGNNLYEIINNLSGYGMVLLTGGYFKNVNLTDMFRNLPGAFEKRHKQMTSFDNLHANFTINNGIATNDNLRVESRLLRASGKGVINLPEYTIYYYLTPELVRKLDKDAGNKMAISVPVVISGDIDAPDIQPDIKGTAQQLLKNPEALKDAKAIIQEELKESGKILKKLKGAIQ